MKRLLIFIIWCVSLPLFADGGVTQYVDPMIGAVGTGRVVIGPSCPFGMVKPSPDCTVHHNSGWAPMPEQVDGFSQTHVSGTGGGPKYGNILIMPFIDEYKPDYRESEDIRLGYYGTQLKSGIKVEVTASERVARYRIIYPKGSKQSLRVDASWFLGRNNEIPDARETQQFVGGEVMKYDSSNHIVSGYTRVRGGWNNGRAYTVYFWIQTSRPLVYKEYTKKEIADFVVRNNDSDTLLLDVGISYISEQQARRNIIDLEAQEIRSPRSGFDTTYTSCVAKWEKLLSRISIDPKASDAQKRMFYTGIYHALLEPVNRSGENPLWTDTPYYDDFYAIWDTYRTCMPLLTLIDPERQTDICNALLNICKRDGYMPDARSGNCNGRTQGGSNAEIVLADAFAKGLGMPEHLNGDSSLIDYEQALQCMLVDATLPPGGNQEAEGRGGLVEYLRLGYVPFGIDRSGNRTVEYAFDDYAIYSVAKGLGYKTLAEQYLKQSSYWKNLWRSDYTHEGARGFIMPRDAEGNWLDELTVGHSRNLKPTYTYTPVTNESPWYTKWWGTFMYEATSWEYSLSIPHDIPGLIEQCGGKDAFEKRLDTFFDRGFYNVNNEPSFLTPCLYHWIGRPDRTSDRVLDIIAHNFNDGPRGLPGNDDSGSMSSWLVFHMMGLYPNAGFDYYVIHTPLLRTSTIYLANGRDFTISAPKLSQRNCHVKAMRLNGKPYTSDFIDHKTILEGGTLELIMGK